MTVRPGSPAATTAAALMLSVLSVSALTGEQPVRLDPPLHPHATVLRGSTSGAIPRNFGTQDLVADVVSAYDFQPFFSTVGYTSSSGMRGATGPGNFQLGASFGRIPQGARLESIQIYFADVSATEDVRLRACRGVRAASTGASAGQECFIDFTSSGSPGFSTVEVPIPADFQDYLLAADVDGDNVEDTVDYYYIAETPGGLSTAIGAIRMNWRRQVHPAPSVATFNDVPTDHPQFQFVEALAASGITAGCGAGNYCPTAALTRGQMAVFLAKALGLHWSP